MSDLPSYEYEFVNRTCYYDNASYEIIFDSSYTEESRDFIARIRPVEVLNCSNGSFRLYRQFNYSVDYISLSPILINNVIAPVSGMANERIDVNIELMQMTNSSENGTLAVFDDGGNLLWEDDIMTDDPEHTASFYAPAHEGLQKYSTEFIQENKTLNYREFSILVSVLEVSADMPVTVPQNPVIGFNFTSYLNDSFVLDAKYYLTHDSDTVLSGNFKRKPKLHPDAGT